MDDAELAERMRLFRTHGITRDPKCFSSLTSLARRLVPRSAAGSHDAKAATLRLLTSDL